AGGVQSGRGGSAEQADRGEPRHLREDGQGPSGANDAEDGREIGRAARAHGGTDRSRRRGLRRGELTPFRLRGASVAAAARCASVIRRRSMLAAPLGTRASVRYTRAPKLGFRTDRWRLDADPVTTIAAITAIT